MSISPMHWVACRSVCPAVTAFTSISHDFICFDMMMTDDDGDDDDDDDDDDDGDGDDGDDECT